MKLTTKKLREIIKEELENFQMNEVIEDLETVENNIQSMSKEYATELLSKIVDMKEAGESLSPRFKFYEALLKKKVGFDLSKEDKYAIARETMLFQRFVELLKKQNPITATRDLKAEEIKKEKDL